MGSRTTQTVASLVTGPLETREAYEIRRNVPWLGIMGGISLVRPQSLDSLLGKLSQMATRK